MTYDDYLKAEQDDERMTRSFQALIDAAIADKIAKGLHRKGAASRQI